MFRLSDSQLETLKHSIPVQSLVASNGVTLKRQGQDWTDCCRRRCNPLRRSARHRTTFRASVQ